MKDPTEEEKIIYKAANVASGVKMEAEVVAMELMRDTEGKAQETLHTAVKAAHSLLSKKEIEATFIKEEAAKIAEDLILHAKETARQMLLGTNLDTSKIPLICMKIVAIDKRLEGIETNLTWAVRIVIGLFLAAVAKMIFLP